MDASSFLKRIYKLEKIVENKLVEREQWKAIATHTTSVMGGERVQSSGNQQKMAEAVNRFVDLDREIDEHIDRLIDYKREVSEVIEQLNATEYDLLHKRYFQQMTFDEVGAAMGKSKSWATTVHGRALQNVQAILDRRE